MPPLFHNLLSRFYVLTNSNRARKVPTLSPCAAAARQHQSSDDRFPDRPAQRPLQLLMTTNRKPDSSQPAFWNIRYKTGKTPWDFGGVPVRLKTYLASTPPGRVLIPGCGSGYDIAAFHSAGWFVTALDFSPEAVKRSKRLLEQLGHLIVLGDFFRYPLEASSFDVVYERTFLCALPLKMRGAYARRMRQLIRPGGQLLGHFLYGREPDPPPHPLTKVQARKLLGSHFALTCDELVVDSLPVLAGRERWQEWTRLSRARK
jgi:SAM-dependent methyltransferase